MRETSGCGMFSGVALSLCERGSDPPSGTDGTTPKPFWTAHSDTLDTGRAQRISILQTFWTLPSFPHSRETARPVRTALHQSHFGHPPYTFWTPLSLILDSPVRDGRTTPKPFWTATPILWTPAEHNAGFVIRELWEDWELWDHAYSVRNLNIAQPFRCPVQYLFRKTFVAF